MKLRHKRILKVIRDVLIEIITGAEKRWEVRKDYCISN